MKTYLQLFLGAVLITGLLLTGCGDNNSSSPTIPVSGTGSIEGQLVANTGTQLAKRSFPLSQHANEASETVYPLSGTPVELVQNGTIVTTTTTDEYGRFHFFNLAAGEYDVRVVANDGSLAHYHVSVNADQMMTVYGRVVSGNWEWEHELGPHWDDMPHGAHWGGEFCGASPGPGYWHNGHEWHEPGTGSHHGPHHA